jgi:hypothetical protein
MAPYNDIEKYIIVVCPQKKHTDTHFKMLTQLGTGGSHL